MKSRLSMLLGFVCIALLSGPPAMGQVVTGNDRAERVLGSVQVDAHAIKLLITYGGDAAVLAFSVTDGGGPEKYGPMFASTYRGMPSVSLDIFVSKAGDAVWIQSSWPGSEVLAYHRLGSNEAVTPFGKKDLLDTPFPSVLSGGPVAFPEFDPRDVAKRASFYHRDAE